MSAQTQVWFISGASRGIGLSIAQVAAKKNYIVFAGGRNPSTATGLQELAANNKNVGYWSLKRTRSTGLRSVFGSKSGIPGLSRRRLRAVTEAA